MNSCKFFESNRNIESEYKKLLTRKLYTKYWRKRWTASKWANYDFEFNWETSKNVRLSKIDNVDSKLIQSVLQWNNVINLLRWINNVVSSCFRKFIDFNNENFNRTSIFVVKQWVEKMINLQKFVYRSRKLNSLIRNWNQNVEKMLKRCLKLSF